MKITKRQMDALLNLYLGDQSREGHRTTDPYESYEKLHGQDVPEWGRPAPHQRGSSMGGATRRMRERMGEMGLFPICSTAGGRFYYSNALTTKALEALKAKFPALPDIELRLAASLQQDAEKAEADRLERERQRLLIADMAKARKKERRERMARVLQDYQITHTLAPDQLEEMWKRIADEEVLEIN